MVRATHEVADVVRRFGDALLREGPVTPARRRVMRALVACRSSQLGGHVESPTWWPTASLWTPSGTTTSLPMHDDPT